MVSEPSRLSLGEKIRTSMAAFIGMMVVGLVSSQFVEGYGLPLMIASMGASAVLLFAAPNSPMAQPWPVIGGHFISVTIGITCAKYIPNIWVGVAVASSLAIFAMHLTHSLHPPGGASALIPVLGNSYVHAYGYHFILAPVGINVILILSMAVLFNYLMPGHRYPARRYPHPDDAHKHLDPAPLDRFGLDHDDLHRALQELDIYLDVSEDDLNRVYRMANTNAYRRKMGEITCADIMSRDLVTAEFGTELENAWAQLRYHKVKALPVIDPARRVIGMLSLVDFLSRADLKTYDGFEDKLLKFIRRTPGLSSDKPEVAGQIMTTPVVTAEETMHIAELVPLLSNHNLHHIPIVNAERRLVGMVTQSDLIAALYAGHVAR